MNLSRRTFSRLLAAAILVATVPHSGSSQQTAGGKANLLSNGDFSKGVDGWNFDPHLKKGQVVVDPSELRNGKPTIRIENIAPDDSTLSQKVSVKPATRYRLEGWVKTKNVGSADSKSTAGASLGLKGAFLKSDSLNKTQSWKRLTVEITTVGETEIAVGPRLGSFGALVTGTAWFSDLELKEVGPARKR